MKVKYGILLVSILASVACKEEEEKTNNFSSAIPSREAITIQTPESQNHNALTIGERSEYYTLTRAITLSVNVLIVGIFSILEDIIALPPTTIDGNKAIWGPGDDGDALNPSLYRLVVIEQSPNIYSYTLAFRNKNLPENEDSYQNLISGTADKTSGVNDGFGTMTLFVDNWGVADGRNCGTGKLDVSYDTATEPQKLEVGFISFSTCEDPDELIDDAQYYYDRFVDGSGNFQFSANNDLQEGAIVPAVNERFEVRSRWDATGAGRSDVRISGGDLPKIAEIITASECWDSKFTLVYATIDPDFVDQNRLIGELADCVFADTSLPAKH
ncbi:MAG: hypothetical protein JW841_03015 [Deltaproteobacteria bacterium]|nr:hypothetical protein [Deltaproteobacteria bacterium]